MDHTNIKAYTCFWRYTFLVFTLYVGFSCVCIVFSFDQRSLVVSNDPPLILFTAESDAKSVAHPRVIVNPWPQERSSSDLQSSKLSALKINFPPLPYIGAAGFLDYNRSGLYRMCIIIQCVHFSSPLYEVDRLCGLVVRVSGYRYRGPGFDSRRYQIF
jgi:hypothetical protein